MNTSEHRTRKINMDPPKNKSYGKGLMISFDSFSNSIGSIYLHQLAGEATETLRFPFKFDDA